MAQSRRILFAICVASIVPGNNAAQAVQPDAMRSAIRPGSARIAKVLRHGIQKSPAFEDLIAALQLHDRVVHIDEGRCPSQVSACLRLMPTPGGKNLLILIGPRRNIDQVVASLAHELYHASEIARDPQAVDEASVRALYKRIGYTNTSCPQQPIAGCWETRAAVAFQTLVMRELNMRQPVRE